MLNSDMTESNAEVVLLEVAQAIGARLKLSDALAALVAALNHLLSSCVR